MLSQKILNLFLDIENIYSATESILLPENKILKMKYVAGTTLRSGLEIILVSSVYEILAVRLSDTGNEKK